jgi:hypothetical protein
VDHLIHALVKDMLPSYEDRHKRQKLGMQGPDLAEKRRKQIIARAPETPQDRIKEIDRSRFEIRSMSSEKTYEVNLLTYTCTCLDYPRIRLCKHIAATVHFFGGGLEGGALGPHAPVNPSEAEPDIPKSPGHQDGNDGSSVGKSRKKTSLISALNYINRLTHDILEMAPEDPNPETIKSVKLAGSQLNAVLISLTGGNESRLPEKEQIAPNQLSWPPTAACMGVKRGEKRRGKVDSALTAEHIGVPKRKRPNDDPYGAGEDSGKRAKPDAVSAAANARARAAEERALKAAECPAPPASLPTRLSPRPAAYALPQPMHAPAMYSQAHFPPPVPYSQPTYSSFQYQYPTSQPYPSPYPSPYPMFSPYTFHPPA